MEFGVSAQLQCGGNVVGVSWTTPSSAPMGDATQLVTTTHNRVQVNAADDQRVLSSWLTRPGSANRFVAAAVQHRSSRQLFAVQDGNRLLAWSERQASMDTAVAVVVRREVYALRVSKHASAVFVVYRDGGVSVYSLKLEELFYAEGVAGSPPPGKQGKAKGGRGDSATTTPPVATWARLTSIPSEPGKLILLVAVQSPPASGGVAAGAPTPTLLRVFTATPPGKGAAPGAQLAFAHRASHSLLPPPGAGSSCRACTLTLHKHYQALTAVWSDGTMQVLRFQKAPHVVVGPQWYLVTPQVILTRDVGTVVPGAPAVRGAAPAALHVTSFALEPSCLVLAGTGAGEGGTPTVFMTVWDVRYGVILGSKDVPLTGAGTLEGDASSGRAAKRPRSASVPPLADDSAPTGSLAASAAALAGAVLPMSAVFQVTVNEDGSYVAAVSRESVHVTPVAVRGASLASALGRLPSTLSSLGGSSAATRASVRAAPVLDLEQLLADTTTSAGGDGTLTAASAERWAGHVARAGTQLDADCTAMADVSMTPTAAHVAAILARYGVYMHGGGGDDAAPGTTVPTSPEDGRKRKRGKDAPSAAPPTAGGVVALQGGEPTTLPYALVVACVTRCVGDLRRGVSARATSGSGLGVAVGLVTTLVRLTAVSAGACPALIPALLAAAALPPVTATGAANGASVAALCALAEMLLHTVDAPETVLVTVFKAAVHAIPAQTLAALWSRSQAAAERASGRTPPTSTPDPASPTTSPHVMGLLYLTALLLRAPRNDVFQEAALTALEADEVNVLLACLLRLLHVHAHAFVHVRPVHSVEALDEAIASAGGGGRGGGAGSRAAQRKGVEGAAAMLPRSSLTLAPASPPLGGGSAAPLASHLPSYGQVLDWLRMTLDAHFTRIVLMAKAGADAGGVGGTHELLLEVARIVKGQVALTEAAAPVRGHLEHLLKRLPFPAAPEPDYAVAVIRV